jgi:small multidrug resistance pump
MHWLYLSVAILSEVIASSALPAAQGFRNPVPTAVVVVGYVAAFYFLSLTLEGIPLGVAYAVWSGVGIALISLFGWVFYRQSLGATEIFGIVLIVVGVVILKFGKGAGV